MEDAGNAEEETLVGWVCPEATASIIWVAIDSDATFASWVTTEPVEVLGEDESGGEGNREAPPVDET